MKSTNITAIVLLALTSAAHNTLSLADNQPQQEATLFGIMVKDATRQEFRLAVHKAGLAVLREDNSFFCDKYLIHGQIYKATSLQACFTEPDNIFAEAKIKYDENNEWGRKDTLISDITTPIKNKYGSPQSECCDLSEQKVYEYSKRNNDKSMIKIQAGLAQDYENEFTWNLNDGTRIYAKAFQDDASVVYSDTERSKILHADMQAHRNGVYNVNIQRSELSL